MITTCTKCGQAYEAGSEEQANEPERLCFACRPRRGSVYQGLIKEILQKIDRAYMDPRHVEAYMRLEHETLDWIPRVRWEHEVKLASSCVQADGEKRAEELARSYGL